MNTTTILPADGSLTDRRFRAIVGTDTEFDPPIPEYETREEWERRRDWLRLHILVSAGLFPTPAKCPLNPRTTGRFEGDGFTIENVYFESYPGFYVTGNLYRPRDGSGPFPGIACPHGHAKFGRFEDIENFSIPARCVTLARQGNIAFSYDMVGYNDSLQIPHDFKGAREYLWGISLLGLQLWNSIRVLDYLESLDEVDNDRLACTGASGGGTQTFLLTAVDDRVKVSVPVNMVSAHMQGGCLCENAPHLRLEATNVEIAAMAAPRPMLLVSATGDWTKNTPTVEYPAIRRIYELYAAQDHLHHVQIDAGHNYNRPSREAMYAWMGRWLHGETDATALREKPYELPPVEKRRVFPNGLPAYAPKRGEVVQTIIHMAQTQLESLIVLGKKSLAQTRTILAASFQHIFDVSRPERAQVRKHVRGRDAESLVLSRPGRDDAIPARLLMPESSEVSVVVLVGPDGGASLLAESALPSRLLAEGHAVLIPDVFRTGESAKESRPTEERHFLTFNQTDLANRVQDILTTLAYAKERSAVVHLVGQGAAGVWALFARAFAPDVRATIIDMNRLNPANETALEGELFLPGLRRAGDVNTAGVLIAPGKLHLHGLSADIDLTPVLTAYAVLGANSQLSMTTALAGDEAILDWLAAEGH